jgi:hypothetical protein
MKKEIYSFKFRFVAFVVLLAFTAMSCSLLNSGEPEGKEKEYPDPTPPTKQKDPSMPTTFYLTETYELSETDTGRTGFFVGDEASLRDFLTVAEDLGDQRIAVRFINAAKNQTISLYFPSISATFPNKIIMDMGPELKIEGTFGPYAGITETFSLTLAPLREGGESGLMEDLVLNKNVFTLYQNDEMYTSSQNTRIRAYLIALAVWVPIQQRFAEMLSQSSQSFGANMSRGLIPEIQYSWSWGWVDDLVDGAKNFIGAIVDFGKNIIDTVVDIFSDAYDAIVKIGVFIGITIPSPIVAIAAAAITVVTVILKLIPDFTDDDEATKGPQGPPPLSPEQKAAPLFEISYEDESGTRHPLPVMKEGQAPDITQEFYIRPHDDGMIVTSGIKFYFTAGTRDTSGNVPELSFEFSSKGVKRDVYEENITSGVTANNETYFEIKKYNGYRSQTDIRTTLTVKVINKTATTDAEHPVYFPLYYLNGTEFAGDTGFVINFLDRPSASELEQVIIPAHTKSYAPDPISESQWHWLEPILVFLQSKAA